MRRKDYVAISLIVILLSISLVLTIEGRMLGEYTGRIGGVIGIIAFVIYAIWFADRTKNSVAQSDEAFQEYLHPIASSKVFPHESKDLAESQKKIVRQLERNHWLFVAQYLGSLIIVPAVAIWAFLFIFAVQPEFDRFMLESAMIGIPFVLSVVIFWIQGRLFFEYFRSTREYLKETRHAVETGQGDVNITTYINLLFNVIRPKGISTDSPNEKQIDQIRDYLRILRILPIIELVTLVSVTITMGLLFGTMGQYILSSFLNLVLYYSFYGLVIAMLIRLVVFLVWGRVIQKWLKLYTVLSEWRENLETTFLQNETDESVGV